MTLRAITARTIRTAHRGQQPKQIPLCARCDTQAKAAQLLRQNCGEHTQLAKLLQLTAGCGQQAQVGPVRQLIGKGRGLPNQCSSASFNCTSGRLPGVLLVGFGLLRDDFRHGRG